MHADHQPTGGLDEDIAVVGMSCRFPGASDVASFWRNLSTGVDSITRFTAEELLAAGVAPEVVRDPSYVRARGVLRDIDRFDAGLFGYAAREAAMLDPQQRLFLECAWEALEDAGHDSERFGGRVGVFGGVGSSGYLARNLHAGPGGRRSLDSFLVEIGNDKDYLTTRVSYKLDLRGPSVAVQTACSTSLVAVHLAYQSLITYQCDMALAGGSTVSVPHTAGYRHEPDSILSPDGRCRSYDAGGQGTVPGSGAGIVVLRRLSDALEDGDTIWAVIRGSAINNDGAAKVGFTAPSVEGQAEVIAEALALAGVEPRSIGYVEGHGTGTVLGDPIETRALAQAFGAGGPDTAYCALGSVKSNVGHLDTAAGVAGLIKAVLALRHGQIPPSLHFQRANPACELDGSPFFVNTELREWLRDGRPRRAGVSSFGIGGTNAHVILEEAPPAAAGGAGRGGCLLPLSARTEPALERAAANLAQHLREHPEQDMDDVAHTLQVGRRQLEHRLAVACSDRDEALAALEQGASRGRHRAAARAAVVFMFPGQGTQHVGMGRGLYEREPGFRRRLDHACELLREHLGEDLRTHLYPEPGREEAAEAALRETRLAQPALFAVGHALAELWMEWGVQPRAMIGHSVGEYVAACLAGVFTLEDGLRLVAARGRLMQQAPAGSMLSVALPAGAVAARLPDGVDVAAVNAADLCVVSGPSVAVDSLERELAAEGVRCSRLETSHAFHSAMQEPVLEPFAAELAAAGLHTPRLEYVSNVTGGWATAEQARDPGYWTAHLRRPVQFALGLETVMAEPGAVLLEVGPGTGLGALARRQPAAAGHTVLASMRHPRDRRDDRMVLLEATAQLWQAGVPIDWAGHGANERRRRVPLPCYPFERQRHWIDRWPSSKPTADAAEQTAAPAPAPAAVANGNDLADVIAAVWREHLGVERSIGATENFFALGGHSLIAVGMAADLRERLRLRVTLGTVFENPTIEALVAAVRDLDRGDLEELLSEVEQLTGEELETALAAEGEAGPAPASLLTGQERGFLDAHEVGRLATVGSGGLPHVVPVNYRWNPSLETIEIGGHRMAESLKFRHVQASGFAAFVVDDLVAGMPRSVEVRGRAEAVEGAAHVLIRIHPSRVAARGLDGTPVLRSRRANGATPTSNGLAEAADARAAVALEEE